MHLLFSNELLLLWAVTVCHKAQVNLAFVTKDMCFFLYSVASCIWWPLCCHSSWACGPPCRTVGVWYPGLAVSFSEILALLVPNLYSSQLLIMPGQKVWVIDDHSQWTALQSLQTDKLIQWVNTSHCFIVHPLDGRPSEILPHNQHQQS